MKLQNRIALAILVPLLLGGCSQPEGETAQEPLPAETGFSNVDPMQERMENRCGEVVSLYYDLYVSADKTEPDSSWETPGLSQNSIDAIETRLLEAGYDVMDSRENYPAYLPTSDRFFAFWDAVQRGEPAEQEVITILESGNLSYSLFTYGASGPCFYSMVYDPEGVTEPQFEMYAVQDWALTEKGNFFYRIYPADNKHYADFTLIRLAAPDTALYDMTLRYILPVNYLAANLFLTDWTDTDFAELSFNDLFEYLYQSRYGRQFNPAGYVYIANSSCFMIPAAEFEKIVMPYFHVDLESFRELARYNAEDDCYPWRPVETNDFVKLWYYTVEPEVTAYTVHSDGTVTLTVEVLSTDLKMDCLFAHEVTIRPLENGQFQYVSNKVTYQTEYGLPFCEPRLTWGETG